MAAHMPTGSQAFRDMCMNLIGYGFKIGFMKSELLKEEQFVVFLFYKYNVAPSSMTTEVMSMM